jgi:hypothetical protein
MTFRGENESHSSRFEASQESEIQRAVAEKIQRAVSSMLNKKIETFIEQNVHQEDLESAASRLFQIAAQGGNAEDLEIELKQVSSKLASELLERKTDKPRR